jgi:hypothetical protein
MPTMKITAVGTKQLLVPFSVLGVGGPASFRQPSELETKAARVGEKVCARAVIQAQQNKHEQGPTIGMYVHINS